MKLFNIFDRWGNKLGEVYEADPDYIGLGGFLGGFGLFIIGAGAVIIWPVCFKLLFHRFTTDYERSCGIVQLLSRAAGPGLDLHRIYLLDRHGGRHQAENENMDFTFFSQGYHKDYISMKRQINEKTINNSKFCEV